MWNPKEAGEVFVTLGDMLAKGQEIKDGMDIPGLGVVHPDFAGTEHHRRQLVELNKNTVDELADAGALRPCTEQDLHCPAPSARLTIHEVLLLKPI